LSKSVSFEEKSSFDRTYLIEQEGIRKELSTENEEPIEKIEGKLVEERKDLNQQNKMKNKMSNEGPMEW
jgi:hypothetical protein